MHIAPHPAYPSSETLRAETRASNALRDVIAENERVAEVLKAARAKIEGFGLDDRDTPCMSPGYDWASILEMLGDMTPATECPVQQRKVAAHVAEAGL